MRWGRTRVVVVLACAVVLVLGGCGGGNKVGEGLEVAPGGEAGDCRLGECTTTTSAPQVSTSTTAKPVATTAKPVATTAQAATTTTTRAQAAFVISIQPDSAGRQFNPSVAKVTRNTLVRWTNTDTVARSVEADDGSFKSPMLAPGASFEHRPATAGRFDYHDGTRPYAIGYLEVV